MVVKAKTIVIAPCYASKLEEFFASQPPVKRRPEFLDNWVGPNYADMLVVTGESYEIISSIDYREQYYIDTSYSSGWRDVIRKDSV